MADAPGSAGGNKEGFLESVPADLALLTEARESLGSEPAEARISLDRFSRFIAREADRFGLSDVAAAANALVDSGTDSEDLIARIDALEAALSGLQGVQPRATILVVEDEPTTQLLLQTALAGPEREILTAGTAEEARVLLESQPIHLIVLDLILPDADGRHLLMELGRERDGSRAAVIVLTAKGTATTRAECFAYGATAFLEKPLDVDVLRSVVKGALDRSHSRHWPDASERVDLPGRDELREAFARQQSRRNPEESPLVVAVVDTDPRGVGWDEEGVVQEETTQMDLRIAEALQDTIGVEDMVGRWGVNELVLVLGGREASACDRLLERAQTALASGGHRPFVAGVNEVAGDATFEDAVSWASRLASEGRMSTGSGILHTTLSNRRPHFALVVEDDPITASLVTHRLGRSGFEVEHYENGIEALEAIRRVVPDLVVLDLRLPGMDGFEILARMKADESTQNVRTVILTGMGRESDVARAFELGADDYIVKPFSPVELTARVLRLVRT